MSKDEEKQPELYGDIENTCQLCLKQELPLSLIPKYCSYCGLCIKEKEDYYSTSKGNGTELCFCKQCHDSLGESITFNGIIILESELIKKNDDKEGKKQNELWVECSKCQRWQHGICGLYNCKRDIGATSNYTCAICYLKEMESKKPISLTQYTVLGAKDLPRTFLSDHLEQRLNRRLREEKEEMAKFTGKSIDEVPGAEGLVVRMVLSINKQLKVKKSLLDVFRDGYYPDEFSYKSKVIFLFQKIDGVDVCLFGMYVQEYGSECSDPNRRCVYISYLDSVKYFRPERQTATGEALRSFVYHEILIGYLEYCKKQGFAACYLWASPPAKKQDFIFNSHPLAIQKTPNPDKLRKWYRSMLTKAAKEKIVVNLTNLYDHFFAPFEQCPSKVTEAHLPYFDGDCWSNEAENIIKDIERKNEESSGNKRSTMSALKAMGFKHPFDFTKDIQLMLELKEFVFHKKMNLFVSHLQYFCSYCRKAILGGLRWSCSSCKNFQLCPRCHDEGLNGADSHTTNRKEKHLLLKVVVDDCQSETIDKDVILDNWLIEYRHTFLDFCQKNRHKFDTLRRAKHSSMMILHDFHSSLFSSRNTCTICKQNTNTNDRNVCAVCHNKHFGSSGAHCASAPSTCETERMKELEKFLQHISQCQATDGGFPCPNSHCINLKKLLTHLSNCQTRRQDGCENCKRGYKLLSLHAKDCRKTNCRIYPCSRMLRDASAQQPRPRG